MIRSKFERAKYFSLLLDKPILFVEDPLKEDQDQWFACNSFSEYNPSNHIHYNELVGQRITDLFLDVVEYDRVMLETKMNEIPKIRLRFPNSVKWFKINL